MAAQAHIFTGTEISTGRRRPSEIVAEYDAKREALAGALAEFEAAGAALKSAATIGRTWGNVTLDTGRGIYPILLEKSLLQSAWRHVYELYGLEQIASAEAKRRYEQMFSAPPPFTVENIRDKFGDLVSDPWGSILRGLAEVFAIKRAILAAQGITLRLIRKTDTGSGRWSENDYTALHRKIVGKGVE